MNAQNRAVQELKITLGGVEAPLSALSPTAQAQLKFAFHGDGSYKLRLRFGKDEWMEKKLGQISAGWAFDDNLTIEPTRLVLKSRQWPQGHPADLMEAEFVEKFSTSNPAALGGNNKKVEAP